MPDPKRSFVSYDRRALEVEERQQQLDPTAQLQVEPAKDLYQSANLHLQSLGVHARIVWGRIVNSQPFLGWYRVQLDDGDGDFPCCRISNSASPMPIGVRDTSTLPPNSPVFIIKHQTGLFGYILGTLPDIVQDGSLSFPDWVSQGSSTGMKRESYYKDMFSLLSEEGGLIQFSGDPPMDGTSLDWGLFTDLGGRLHLDPLMMQFAMDETCGLHLFYHDQLTRLAGHNFDLRTAISSLTVRDDEGEAHSIYGEAMYPWEALGVYRYGTQPHREESDEDVQYNKPYGKLEPSEDDQQPFYRYREFGGYLGQGRMRELALPPTSGTTHNMGDDIKAPGVFREQVMPDGAYALESAKSVIIAKRSSIPTAHQQKPPEDYSEEADNPSNYKASSQLGSGKEHKVRDFTPTGGDIDHIRNTSGVMDLHSYAFNWKSVHPFHYHENDYKLAEQKDLIINKVQSEIDFSVLKDQQWLNRPTPKKMRVDHRYGNVDYFDVLSHLSLLDDGGIVIGDGYGAEIVLSGGDVRIRTAGDIVLESGRSTVVLAGDDLVLRAKSSADLSASEHDVRIKAKNNLHLLGGNNSRGGVLIESKGTGSDYEFEGKVGEEVISPGILLKSSHAQIAAMGAGVYLRTGSNEGDVGTGPIVLDADKGNANIIEIGRDIHRFIDNQAVDAFDVSAPRTVNTYSTYVATIGSGIEVDGYAVVNGGGLVVKGNINVVGGHIGTEFSAGFQGRVGDLARDAATLARISARLDKVHETNRAVTQREIKYRRSALVEQYYATGKIGNEDLQKVIGFSFRNEEQYGTENFRLPESHWQRLARAGGHATFWKEDVVEYGGQELMPYPGTKKWRDEATFQMLDPKLYNIEEGRDKERTGDTYEDPQFGSFTGKKPDEAYPVIK